MNKTIFFYVFAVFLIYTLIGTASAENLGQSNTYIIDCSKGTEFKADVTAQDTIFIDYNGTRYKWDVGAFCKLQEFSPIGTVTGGVVLKEKTAAIDLNEDGTEDLIVSHSNCITGQGTINVKLAGEIATDKETSSTNYLLTATWAIMLLTIVICVLIITYVTTRIYKVRRSK